MFDISKRNYLKSKDTTNKMMNNVIIALIPIMVFAWIRNGIYPYFFTSADCTLYDLVKPLLIMIIPALTTYYTEYFYYKKSNERNPKEKTKHSYAILPGLFLGLILPINTPLYAVVLGALCATLIGKIIFGGFSHNIFNPALLGRLFIIFMFAGAISSNGGYHTAIDTTSSATPLSFMANNSYNLTTDIPYSLGNLFLGFHPGCLGEVSILLCIIAFVYLTATKTIKHRIPICYITTVFVITMLIGIFTNQQLDYAFYQIFSGGLFFGAIFMATDPVTSPITNYGQIVYGICLGILTCVFRYLTPYPEGVLTAILTMNLLVGLINILSIKTARYKSLAIVILVAIATIVVVTCSNKIYVKEEVINYIDEKTINNDSYMYKITKKGYVADITIELVINKGQITSIDVLSQQESFYAQIESNNYLNKFVTNINLIDDIDTISGVTKTSSTIKEIVLIAIEDYLFDNPSYENEDIVPPVEEQIDFEILNIELNDNINIYTVKKKGFVADIVANITFIDNQFDSIEIISETESYYYLIEDSSFIEDLNTNKDITLDTVSGATKTSSTIKEMIELTYQYIGGLNE